MQSRLTLSALLLLTASACSPQPNNPQASSATPAASASAPAAPAPVASPTDGPPTENGLYAAHGACPFEGCDLRVWKATAKVDLREAPNAAAKVVVGVPAGEWVTAVESVEYLFPERGVVVKASDTLKPGDVIYLLDHQGEGVFWVWRRGEKTEWTDEGERDASDPSISSGVKWDTLPDTWPEKAKADEAHGAGWWVRFKRASGEAGWALAKDNFDCTDSLGGEPECETHQKAAQK